ncbi:MAG: hypothetical protein ACRDOX_01120, partial [Nocardioides sp.]
MLLILLTCTAALTSARAGATETSTASSAAWTVTSFESLAHTPDPPAYGDTVTLTGRLIGVDAPAEVELVWVSGGSFVRPFTTQPDGTFSTTLPVDGIGPEEYTLKYHGDAEHSTATASYQMIVQQAATTVTLDPLPERLSPEEAFTLTGHVSGASAPASILLTDDAGYQHRQATDADGNFAIPQVTRGPGPATWRVDYDGGQYHLPSTATASEYVLHTQALWLHTDRLSYTAGMVAMIEVKLGDSLNRNARIVAIRPDGITQRIWSGEVPQDGLVLRRTMLGNQRIQVVAPADWRHLRGEIAVSRKVRMQLVVNALDPASRVGTSGKWSVYQRATDPRFKSRALPRRSVCVRYVVQH